MTPENFTYWLQGFFEISNPNKLDETQVQIIKDHLDLVFNKVTPDRSKSVLQDLKPNKFDWLMKDNGTIQPESDLNTKVYCATSFSYPSISIPPETPVVCAKSSIKC